MLATLALPTIAFMVEFDVEHVDGAVEALQAGELLRDVCPEVFGYLDVAALDHDFGGGGVLRLIGGVSQHRGGIRGLA